MVRETDVGAGTSAGTGAERKPGGRPRDERQIGAILFEAGAITAEALEEAVRLHRERGERLGETLVRVGHVDEEEVLRARATQLGIDTIRLGEVTLDLTLLAGLPLRFLHRRRILPLRREGRRAGDRVEVAVTDVVKREDIEYLSDYFSAPIEPRLTSAAQIDAAFRLIARTLREARGAPKPRKLRSGTWRAIESRGLRIRRRLAKWAVILGLFAIYAIVSNRAIFRYYAHMRGEPDQTESTSPDSPPLPTTLPSGGSR